MDTVLVYNPTDHDYICYFDKFPNVIPHRSKDMGFGEGKMQLVRYIAEKYMVEMKNKLITEKADEILEKSKINREEKGLSLDPYEVNASTMNIVPKTNDEKEIAKVYGTLYRGLVREYGLYDQPITAQPEKIDQRTPEERALDKIMGEIDGAKEPEKEEIEPVDDTKGSVLDGIEFGEIGYGKKKKLKKSRLTNG